MYTKSFERGYLLLTLYTANITLILKKDRPADQYGSYRPISVDSKVLSKLLARRLEMLLPKIINTYQTRFIKNIQHKTYTYTNMRKLLNVIQHANETRNEGLVISLDAKKAFDRIE